MASDCSHDWDTVDVAIKGRGHGRTYVVERCSRCGDLRIDYDVEVVEEVGGA